MIFFIFKYCSKVTSISRYVVIIPALISEHVSTNSRSSYTLDNLLSSLVRLNYPNFALILHFIGRERSPPVRPRTPPPRHHGHGRAWLPHGEYGQTSLRNNQGTMQDFRLQGNYLLGLRILLQIVQQELLQIGLANWETRIIGPSLKRNLLYRVSRFS